MIPYSQYLIFFSSDWFVDPCSNLRLLSMNTAVLVRLEPLRPVHHFYIDAIRFSSLNFSGHNKFVELDCRRPFSAPSGPKSEARVHNANGKTWKHHIPEITLINWINFWKWMQIMRTKNKFLKLQNDCPGKFILDHRSRGVIFVSIFTMKELKKYFGLFKCNFLIKSGEFRAKRPVWSQKGSF